MKKILVWMKITNAERTSKYTTKRITRGVELSYVSYEKWPNFVYYYYLFWIDLSFKFFYLSTHPNHIISKSNHINGVYLVFANNLISFIKNYENSIVQ